MVLRRQLEGAEGGWKAWRSMVVVEAGGDCGGQKGARRLMVDTQVPVKET